MGIIATNSILKGAPSMPENDEPPIYGRNTGGKEYDSPVDGMGYPMFRQTYSDSEFRICASPRV